MGTVTLALAAEMLERLEVWGRGAGADDLRLLLDRASEQMAELLGAQGCAVSRLQRELLFDAGEYSPPPLVVLDGHSYLIADYPATGRVLAKRTPAIVSLDDPKADAAELFVLEHVGARSVLMLPLVIEGRSWGLVELYRTTQTKFMKNEVALARIVVACLAQLVAATESRARTKLVYRETLASLGNALELKSAVTRAHADEVVDLALVIGRRMRLTNRELDDLELGALLHDIGKIRVPDSILNKPGPLTSDEWKVMREHPALGESILAPISSLAGVLPIVRSHHERWDGGGYPDGLVGTDIPLGARIIAVCDTYSAMSQDRPYRPECSRTEIIHELQALAGSQFDPGCVRHLLTHISEQNNRTHIDQLIRRPPLPKNGAGAS